MSGLLLADGNNLVMRAFLAPKHDMSSHEIETGTLVIFLNILARHVRMEQPDLGMICWDGGGSAYRKRIFPEYKANRVQKYSDDPQPPFDIIMQFLRLAGFPQLQLPGYEGDDLIAAYWRACKRRSRIQIVTGDKDMFQLVDNATDVLRPVSGADKPDRWTRQRFIQVNGYKPEQVPLVMALMGDKIDGIPGLTRVGPKTAVKMLNQHGWDLNRLVDSLPEDDQFVVMRNLALVDLSLVPLELDEPPLLKLVTPSDQRWGALENFLDYYELQSIKKRLITESLW